MDLFHVQPSAVYESRQLQSVPAIIKSGWINELLPLWRDQQQQLAEHHLSRKEILPKPLLFNDESWIVNSHFLNVRKRMLSTSSTEKRTISSRTKTKL